MERRCFIIDAFTSEPFRGNPAAVVFDADGLDDAAMQSIAAEFNLSETTFILRSELPEPDDAAAVRFRWFTPTTEVSMCGHATIAGIHAMVESGRIRWNDSTGSAKVRIETCSGLLTGFAETPPGPESRRMIWLDLLPPTSTRLSLSFSDFARALRASTDLFDPARPPIQTPDRDIIAFVRDFMVLNDLRPDFPALATLLAASNHRGLCLATTRTVTPSIHVQSRFFAPSVGVNEDPVTGSVHGPLAACLATHGDLPIHDGIAAATCSQGIPGGRTGVVYALVQIAEGRCEVRIGGFARTIVRGQLTL